MFDVLKILTVGDVKSGIAVKISSYGTELPERGTEWQCGMVTARKVCTKRKVWELWNVEWWNGWRDSWRWCEHNEMKSEEFVRKACVSEGLGRRKRSLGRGERSKQAKRKCLNKKWKLFCYGHPLWGTSWRERGIDAIYIDRLFLICVNYWKWMN